MLALLFSSLIWAFSYGLIKGNLTNLSPDFVAWTRMIIPFLLFMPFFSKKNLSIKHSLFLFFIGAVQYGIMYLLVIRSYAYLQAHQIVLFTAFVPIYVTLIHNLWQKSFSLFQLGIAILSFLGVLCIYLGDLTWNATLKGFLLVQLSDLCFAFGQVAYKRFRKKHKELQDQNVYALLFFGGVIITGVSTSSLQGWSSFALLTAKQNYLLLYLGAIASGLCFFLWNRASVKTPIGTLAVFNNVKIPLGVLVSLVFFQEKANYPGLFISFLFLFTALILSHKFEKKTISQHTFL